MKHLKLFETEAQYESYKNGSDFVLPNVSYCEDGKLFYNANKLIILTFKIEDAMEYQFIEGMTWGEFINSEYNPANSFRVNEKSDGCLNVTGLTAGYVVYADKYVKANDKIIANTEYSYGVVWE